MDDPSVWNALPKPADKLSAGAARDQYLDECKKALGRLNRMVDLLHGECKGGAEYRTCRRSLFVVADPS